ncbi:lipopolysaccharide biosynthesis protein [Pseudomonas huanghezhanensis]|uniref:lipopolysaccharide biosynthesis protein n=1 Tax=Pseudomonas huanghezhanensis TaxID=3002903 RepID=UPI00228588FB|nr:lipopolysaccharide biosynthesis protein [Pseudomonas sp. BSw22131]
MSANFTANKIGRGAFWSIINQSVAQILALLVFLVTARFVSKEAFGIMAVCLLLVEAFRQIGIESVAASIVSRRDIGDETFNAAFVLMLTSGAAGALILFLLAEPIAALLGNKEIASSLQWTSILLFTTGLSKTHEAWLTKQLMFKVLAIRSLLAISIGGAIGIWMAIQGYGLLSLIAQQLVTSLVGTATLWMTTRWKPSIKTTWKDVSSVLSHSRHVSLSAAASFVSMQSDVFFASYYLGAAETGVFNAAKRISVAMWLMISSSLNSVALPIQAALRDDAKRSSDAYLKCVYLSICITGPLYVGIAALSPDVVFVLLGSKWADVAPVLAFLSLSAFVTALSQYNSNILMVFSKAHWQTTITLISGAGNFILFFILARHGLLALTSGFLIKTIVFSPLSILPTLRLLGIGWVTYLKRILAPLISSLIMGACIYFLALEMSQFSPGLRLLLLIPAGVVIYLAVMLATNRHAVLDVFSLFKQTLRRDK